MKTAIKYIFLAVLLITATMGYVYMLDYSNIMKEYAWFAGDFERYAFFFLLTFVYVYAVRLIWLFIVDILRL